MPILDQFGRPIQVRSLPKEVAAAESFGTRRPIYDTISAGMTPGDLATILDEAVNGNIENYITLAEEMEERYLHYFGVLSARKLAVAGAPFKVEPYDDSAKAVEIAQTYEKEVVNKPEFEFMVFDLLDALGKGFSVVEMIWNTKTNPWTIDRYEWRDQRWFQFDMVSARELRLRDETNPDGLPLPAGSFLVHYPHIKTGVPIRGGLARMAAICYMAQNYTLKDWLAFMEVYGMPIRVGKYDPNTIDHDSRLTLRTALANLGHDAAAMIPDGMDIEIVDIKRGTGGDKLFEGLATYLDKQVSKGVLGQTMTTDDGSSLAQAEVHQDVKHEYCESDAIAVSATIQKGNTRPWTQLNYGENAPVPKFSIDVSIPENLEAFTKAALPWVEKAGLRVGARFLRDKFSIPDPDEDGESEILGGSGESSSETGDPNSIVPDEEGSPELQARGAVRKAEDLAEDGWSQWARVMAPHHKAIKDLAERSKSYEEFQAGLTGLVKEMDSDPFVSLLAVQMAKARGVGAA